MAALKRCATCPELVPQGTTYCTTCTHARDTKRGTRQQRGYGTAHQAQRKRWMPKVDAGLVSCWRCGERISPLEPWDMGHDDHDRTKWRGPEHPACNRATHGRIAPGA